MTLDHHIAQLLLSSAAPVPTKSRAAYVEVRGRRDAEHRSASRIAGGSSRVAVESSSRIATRDVANRSVREMRSRIARSVSQRAHRSFVILARDLAS